MMMLTYPKPFASYIRLSAALRITLNAFIDTGINKGDGTALPTVANGSVGREMEYPIVCP